MVKISRINGPSSSVHTDHHRTHRPSLVVAKLCVCAGCCTCHTFLSFYPTQFGIRRCSVTVRKAKLRVFVCLVLFKTCINFRHFTCNAKMWASVCRVLATPHTLLSAHRGSTSGACQFNLCFRGVLKTLLSLIVCTRRLGGSALLHVCSRTISVFFALHTDLHAHSPAAREDEDHACLSLCLLVF